MESIPLSPLLFPSPQMLILSHQQIEHVGIIPFDMSQMNEGVERSRHLNPVVSRNFADILLATMTTLYKLYSSLKQGDTPYSPLGSGGREQVRD